MENYAWYQQQFDRRVISVHGACGGLGFLTKVKSEFPSGRAGIKTGTEVSPVDLLARLERLCPGFEAWASAQRDIPKQ